ncbi:MAG: ABC transporter ATP-binding protein [Planctomycetota bacterium]|jgi:ABC-type lipoprotein export system ATPase subunit
MTQEHPPILQLEAVCKTYKTDTDTVHALQDIHLTLSPGDFASVQGPSVSGKSTLLLTSAGLLTPDSGAVTLNGERLADLSADQRAHRRAQTVGFVFQQFHLAPYLTVYQNVIAAAFDRMEGAAERARQLLDRFELTDRLDHTPDQLSTGQRQRTALARAMLNEPRLILADEPTGNLDPDNAGRVLDELDRFASDGGAVMLVTHQPEAADRARSHYNLVAGRLDKR